MIILEGIEPWRAAAGKTEAQEEIWIPGTPQSARNLGSGNPAQWFSLLQYYRQVRREGWEPACSSLVLTDRVQCCRLKTTVVAVSLRDRVSLCDPDQACCDKSSSV